MTEKTNLENKSIFCPECRTVISLGEIQKEKKVSLEYIFCPHCGKKINFTYYQKEKKGILEYTYKHFDIKDLENALELIDKDTKFPHVFKKTLHHLIARVIYIEFRKFEENLGYSISEMDLSQDLVDSIEEKLIPISNDQPNSILFKFLDKISYKKFLSFLKKYQKRLRKDINYRNAFKIYQKWIIEMVFRIISQTEPEEELLLPEQTIRDDLGMIFGIDKDLDGWSVDKSLKIIDFCYRTYKDHNYDLKDIIENKNNVIHVIFSALQLRYTNFIKNQFYNILRVIYYLIDFENGITTKKELIEKSGSSKRIVNRVINRLENEFSIDLSKRFHKKNMKNQNKLVEKDKLNLIQAEKRKFWVEIINNSEKDRYLQEIYMKLSDKDFRITKKWISNYLGGGRFGMYIKGSRMPYQSLIKLKELILNKIPKKTLLQLYNYHSGNKKGFEEKIIPYKLYLTRKDTIPYSPLPKNEDTAELISIMLGDGHLADIHNDKKVQITLNRIDEENYFKYVGQLLKKIFPNADFRITKTKGKGYDWKTVNSRIHYALCELGKGIKKQGLLPGDKVENQVSVPEWILSNKSYIKRALKGLFDTDGSISVSRKNQLTISFSNSSKNLVEDFHLMCNKIDVHSGEIFEVRNGSWRVAIHDSIEIKKFLNMVKPEKIKEPYHFIWLGLNIIYRRSPKEIKGDIKNKIIKWKKENINPNPCFAYTKKNSALLKQWLEIIFQKKNVKVVFGYEFGGKIKSEMIKTAFETALLSQYELISYSKRKKSEKYRIHWCPEEFRNDVIDFVIKNIDKKNDKILSKYFESIINAPKKMAALNPFNLKKYNEPLKDYIKSIILVIKEIHFRAKKGKRIDQIGHYSLESYFKKNSINLAFGRRPIKKILKYIIQQNFNM